MQINGSIMQKTLDYVKISTVNKTDNKACSKQQWNVKSFFNLFTNIIIYMYLLFVPKCFQLRSVEETTQAMAFDGIILEVLFTLSLSFLSSEA